MTIVNIEDLRREMDATLALLGCTGIAQFERGRVIDAAAPKNS